MTPAFMRAALWYPRIDWLVFPLAAKGKTPLTPHGCKDATRDTDTIAKHWERWPNANVGIATGAASGLVVLDVDPKHGGEHSLETLVDTHGQLPHTVEAVTGGGGRHILFAHPGGTIPNSVGALGPGLDIRGDGGYIVAPPSVHANGRRYEWEGSSRPGEVALAPMPGWLLERVQAQSTGQRKPPEHWRKLVCEGVREGGRNQAVASLAGHLLRRHVDPVMALELVLHWADAKCKPPLDHTEIIATVDKIAARELRRRKGAS